MTRRARGPSGGQWTAQHASPTLVIITLLALWELAASAGWLRPILFPPPSRLALAIWDDYNFDPTFDSDYVKDMDLTTQYLLATGRVKTAKNPLDYTFTAPLAALEPGLVKVPGQFKA